MEIVDTILANLRIPEARRSLAIKDNLIDQNREISLSSVPGFIYRGICYRHSSCPKGKLQYPELDKSLREKADAWLADTARVDLEFQIMKQVLMPLIAPCKTLEDIRNVLPECLVQMQAESFYSLPRTDKPAWTVEPGSRAYEQFFHHLPKIEFFAATRLIY